MIPLLEEVKMDYYKIGAIECIEYLESLKIAHDFCLGNCLKYLSRFPYKYDSPIDQLADLKKAQWYLNRLITYYEKPNEKPKV